MGRGSRGHESECDQGADHSDDTEHNDPHQPIEQGGLHGVGIGKGAWDALGTCVGGSGVASRAMAVRGLPVLERSAGLGDVGREVVEGCAL